MTTSKDVFAKRREGHLDEAYQMALHQMAALDKGDWDDKAFGWCLIDLIKRDAKAGVQENLGHYRQQLEAIEIPPGDDVLTKQRLFAISLCNPSGQIANKAKQLSKSGQHESAAEIYRKLFAATPTDESLCTSLGWELYRISKALLDKEPVNILAIKKILNEYLKLPVEKPSLLHSVILQVASKFAGAERFSMVAFSHIWGLENLRADDWNRFITDDRKEFPSLAEKVIQHASKEAARGSNQEALAYILPHVDRAISEYPDNIWLSLNKAKLLLGLGRNDDALKYALDVTRAKSSDYWAWELLGDISKFSGNDLSLSCYCKALLCSSDDRFSGKVRLKLAELLVGRGQLAEAKYEINRVVVAKEREGNRISAEAEAFISQDWYAEGLLPQSNEIFYRGQTAAAEDLLFSQFPWLAANLGDVFTIPGKENKPKRKLYLETASVPVEVVIPDGKFVIPGVEVGDAIRVKGEWDTQKRFQVHLLTNRESVEHWDIFTECIGVVDHVNHQKKLIHFLVDKVIDGVVPFSELDSTYQEGDAISLKLSKYTTARETRYRTLVVKKSNSVAPISLRKEFHESVDVNSGGFGFTDSNIFIPPDLVRKHNIDGRDLIKGIAILTYNKKRREWGWKAISVSCGY